MSVNKVKTKVGKGKYGRGVFATRDFKKGDIIELAPVVVLPSRQVTARDRLNNYVFAWDRACVAIALGNGSLFNHSTDPDAHFRVDKKRKLIVFVADRTIRRGQEIFVSYGYDPADHPMCPNACDKK